MPQPDLTPEEYAEIVRLVRSAIDGERYVLSPRVKRLKNILAKLDPAPSATPYPAPRPSAEPSFLYAKLRGVRRQPQPHHRPRLSGQALMPISSDKSDDAESDNRYEGAKSDHNQVERGHGAPNGRFTRP